MLEENECSIDFACSTIGPDGVLSLRFAAVSTSGVWVAPWETTVHSAILIPWLSLVLGVACFDFQLAVNSLVSIGVLGSCSSHFAASVGVEDSGLIHSTEFLHFPSACSNPELVRPSFRLPFLSNPEETEDSSSFSVVRLSTCLDGRDRLSISEGDNFVLAVDDWVVLGVVAAGFARDFESSLLQAVATRSQTAFALDWPAAACSLSETSESEDELEDEELDDVSDDDDEEEPEEEEELAFPALTLLTAGGAAAAGLSSDLGER